MQPAVTQQRDASGAAEQQALIPSAPRARGGGPWRHLAASEAGRQHQLVRSVRLGLVVVPEDVLQRLRFKGGPASAAAWIPTLQLFRSSLGAALHSDRTEAPSTQPTNPAAARAAGPAARSPG